MEIITTHTNADFDALAAMIAVNKLYPEAKLFAGPLEERKGMVSYAQKIEEEMLNFITSRLLEYVPKNIFFPCLI